MSDFTDEGFFDVDAVKKKGALRIVLLGGLGEIGMNCMALEYEDQILVLDCGVMFSDLNAFGIEYVTPDFDYLVERKDKIIAVVLTHGHEDHIGSVQFLIKAGVRAPMYATSFTAKLIGNKLREHGLEQAVEVRNYKFREALKLGPFTVTSEPVNHSIVEANALFIDTPLGKIIHTGDFRMDPTPSVGKEMDYAIFKRLGDEGVLLLMSESTNIERIETGISEKKVFENFQRLLAQKSGLTVVALFASNIGRMMQIVEVARALGKKVAFAGRSMDTNFRLAVEAGYIPGGSDWAIGMDEINAHPRGDVLVLASGSQADSGAALTRAAYGENRNLQLQKGDRVLMSSRNIPGNEKPIARLINQLCKIGVEVLYEPEHDIHVSGHATRPELKKMIELVRPKFFLPIHGEYRFLVKHAQLGHETGLAEDHVIIASNGDVLEIDKKAFRLLGKLEGEAKTLIEGSSYQLVDKDMLRERRRLGESGVVTVAVVRDEESKEVIHDPVVTIRGVVSTLKEDDVLLGANKVVDRVVVDYETQLKKKNGPTADLAENLRVELRRYFSTFLNKKPTVIPTVMDV